jgi:hypothetical protein
MNKIQMNKIQTEGKLRGFFLHCIQNSLWERGLGNQPTIAAASQEPWPGSRSRSEN